MNRLFTSNCQTAIFPHFHIQRDIATFSLFSNILIKEFRAFNQPSQRFGTYAGSNMFANHVLEWQKTVSLFQGVAFLQVTTKIDIWSPTESFESYSGSRNRQQILSQLGIYTVLVFDANALTKPFHTPFSYSKMNLDRTIFHYIL